MKPSKAVLSLTLLLPLASAHAQTLSAPEQQVLTLVQRFTTAQAAYDVSTLRDTTADNYMEVSPVGDVDPRDKMLSFYSGGEERLLGVSVTLSEPLVRLFGPATSPATSPDTGIVIAKLTFALPAPNNATRTVEMRATFVARKFPSGWKLVSTEVTGLHPAKPAPPQ